MEKEKKVILWQDVVSIKDLLISVIISIVLTMGMYFIAPENATMKLLFGLLGSIIAVILNSILFRPKRKVEIEK